MSSRTVPADTTCVVAFYVQLWPGGLLTATAQAELDGVDPYLRHYHAHRSDVEETAAFYDDVDHDIRNWASMLRVALDSVCHTQAVLL